MRAINLLPKQVVGERSAGLNGKLPFVGAAAVPVIAAILVFVGYSSGHSAVAAKQAQLDSTNAEVLAAKPAVVAVSTAPVLNTSSLVGQRTQRLAALQAVLGNEVSWDTTLRDVARVLPDNVWLTSLTVTSPTPADQAPPAPVVPSPDAAAAAPAGDTPAPAPVHVAPAVGFSIDGATFTQEDVAAVLQRLQLLPALTDVTLVSTTKGDIGGGTAVQFTVTASLQPATVGSQP